MQNKKVFITGGTGSVGQCLIEAFSKDCYDVYFQYNSNIQTANTIIQKYQAKGIQINFLNDYVLPDIDFDIIVNNLGVNISDTLTHLVSNESWKTTIFLNLEIPFQIIKKYLFYMMKNKWGRIINISSIYGLRASEQNLPYTVSKHGLTGITQTIAKEYAQYGISCNEICPSAIESKMMQSIALSAVDRQEVQSIDEYFDDDRKEIPAQRMAFPNDISHLTVFLATEHAGFINGVSIPIDGGLIC
jgi:NAD(P)-dependent dehydrogenase (short-subunit alcohol dehydrogenase family)